MHCMRQGWLRSHDKQLNTGGDGLKPDHKPRTLGKDPALSMSEPWARTLPQAESGPVVKGRGCHTNHTYKIVNPMLGCQRWRLGHP